MRALDATTAWAAGRAGVVLRTADGGAAWQSLSRGRTQPVTDLAAVSADVAWAVVSDCGIRWSVRCAFGVSVPLRPSGAVLRTTDGGATWAEHSWPAVERALVAVGAADAETAWVATGTDAGDWTIERTTDGGGRWTVQWRGEHRPEAFAVVDGAVVWAVGDNGMVLRTADSGATWASPPAGTSARLVDAAAVDARTAWVMAADGTVLRTADGGATWTKHSVGASAAGERIAAVDGAVAWALISGGIVKTTDGGVTWSRQPTGSVVATDIVAVGPSTAWAVGAGAVLRTTDGGATWASQPQPAAIGLTRVAAADVGAVWIAGEDGGILRGTPG